MYLGDDEKKEKKSTIAIYIAAILVIALGSGGAMGYYLTSLHQAENQTETVSSEKTIDLASNKSEKMSDTMTAEEASVSQTEASETETVADSAEPTVETENKKDMSGDAEETSETETADKQDETSPDDSESEEETEEADENDPEDSKSEEETEEADENDPEDSKSEEETEEADKKDPEDSKKEEETEEADKKDPEDSKSEEETEDTEVDLASELSEKYKDGVGIYTVSVPNSINLYTDADSESSVSGTVSDSFSGVVTEQKKVDDVTWDNIDYYGLQGWIEDDKLLKIGENNQINDYLSATQYAYTENTETVSIQKAPGEGNEALGEIDYGTEISITNTQDGWGEFEHNGQNAWIRLSDVATYIPWGKYCVNTSDGGQVNVRTEANGTSPVIDVLSYGDTVSVEEFQKGWAKISSDNVAGWVSMKFLTSCEDASFGESLKANNTQVQTVQNTTTSNTTSSNSTGSSQAETPSYDNTPSQDNSSGSGSSDSDNSSDELQWNGSDELEWQ